MNSCSGPSGIPTRAGIGARIARGVVALLAVGFAVTLFPTDPVIAIAAGLFALLFAAMAVTGQCPTNWFVGREGSEPPFEPVDFPDGREFLDVAPKPAKRAAR